MKTPVFLTQLGKGKYKLSSPEVDTKLSTLANGVYFYRITLSDGVNSVSKVRKVVILR